MIPDERALAGLFPAGVALAIARPDEAPPALRGEEAEAVARAVPARQGEFARGRACARSAMGQLGLAQVAIPMRVNRAPRWPEGVIGAITHCEGLVAAVVAQRGALIGLGLDAEPLAPLDPELSAHVCSDAERERTEAWPGQPAAVWQKLIFSAKEAVHKIVEPLTGVMLDFPDVEIEVDARQGSFVVRAISPTARSLKCLDEIRGRLHLSSGHLVTGAWLAGPQTDPA